MRKFKNSLVKIPDRWLQASRYNMSCNSHTIKRGARNRGMREARKMQNPHKVSDCPWLCTWVWMLLWRNNARFSPLRWSFRTKNSDKYYAISRTIQSSPCTSLSLSPLLLLLPNQLETFLTLFMVKAIGSKKLVIPPCKNNKNNGWSIHFFSSAAATQLICK